jgi:Flp pilus assembly pilin Flp
MRNVRNVVVRFVREQEGQDLVEYTLLLAFVCLSSAALFIGAGSTLAGIWTTANTVMVSANAAVSTS